MSTSPMSLETGQNDQPQQGTGHFRFLELPSRVRDQIYEELLCVNKTATKTVRPDWRYQPLFLENGFPTPEWNFTPYNIMVTRFNFQLAILRVNRQIYHEASPFFGWKNNWVRLILHDGSLAVPLRQLNCAKVLPKFPILTIGGTDRWAMEISMFRTEYDSEPGLEMAMTINEIEDFASIITHPCWATSTFNIRINKAEIFPRSYALNVEKAIWSKFEPLCYPVLQSISPLVSFLVTKTDRTTVETKGILKMTVDDVKLAKFARKGIKPFNKVRGRIDWNLEKVNMIKWTIKFAQVCNKGGYPTHGSEFRSVWDETYAFANLKMAIIYVAFQNIEQIAMHETRTRQETPSVLQWYYGMAIRSVIPADCAEGQNPACLILEIGDCISHIEDQNWLTFLMYWARGISVRERSIFELLKAAVQSVGINMPFDVKMNAIRDTMNAEVNQMRSNVNDTDIHDAQQKASHVGAGVNHAQSVCANYSIPHLRL